MPSTLVHLGLAGLVAAALLAESFDAEAVAVVLGATVFVDLDVFVGLVIQGTHRAAFHTYLLPALLALLVVLDARRPAPLLARWRPDGVRVAAVAVVAVAVAAIALDMVVNGVNAAYPLHDQFYTVDGRAFLSDQRGLVQTFVELDPAPQDGGTSTTDNTHYVTGVDPSRGSEPTDVERKFWLVASGWQLLLAVGGLGTLGFRLWERRDEGGRLAQLRSRLR